MLNANEIIVVIETPFARVRVSKTSAGIIQDSGPQVAEKEKLYSQVIMMKPQCAPLLLVEGGEFGEERGCDYEGYAVTEVAGD